MNRCAICDTTDEENPKANIQECTFEVQDEGKVYLTEMRCEECHRSIQQTVEEMNLTDEEFKYSI